MQTDFKRNAEKPAGRIPSLDGLRAISIAVVLAAHVSGTANLQLSPYTHMLSNVGPFGVKVFFVISGYLITTLLLKEEQRYGRISIGDFYLRRAFRIWPVAYLFILVVAILASRGSLNLPSYNLVFASTFTMNHAPEGVWWTGHLWSLAVEEQFYVIWPPIFALCSLRGRLVSCIAIVCLAPVFRIVSAVYAPGISSVMAQSLLFVGDAIAIGCLLALLAPRLCESQLVKRTVGSNWFAVVPIVALAMYSTLSSSLWPMFHAALGDSICLICVAATLWRVVNWNDPVSRLLNSRPFVTVGVLSYSLYIWQQLFLNKFSTHWLNHFPQNMVLTFITAAISYRFIEIPFLQLRNLLKGRLRSRPIAPVMVTE